MKTAGKKGLLRKTLIRCGWTALALLVVLNVTIVATFVYYRLYGITKEQEAALALMHKDWRPAHGVNAFPLLFYMNYDVPADRLDAQMAADVAKIRKQLAIGNFPSGDSTDALPLPELSDAEQAVLCNAFGDNGKCLAQVAAHADAVRAALAAHSVIAQREQALERADFNWNELPGYLSPRYMAGSEGQKLWLSGFALKYVQGDRIGALAATCRNIAAWRRIARNTNSMIGTMVASGSMSGAIQLYAEMLAGLPADAAVPEGCVLALQPVVAADVDRCAALAGEFAIPDNLLVRPLNANIANTSVWWRRRLNPTFNMRQTEAWMAQPFAVSCTQDAITRLLADEYPYRPPELTRPFMLSSWNVIAVPPGVKAPECIANMLGCLIVNAYPPPKFEHYDMYTRDHAARLRLAATLLWLREHPGGSIAERFARRPAELRSPNHDSGFDAKHGVLYVEKLHEASDKEKTFRFELPVTSPH